MSKQTLNIMGHKWTYESTDKDPAFTNRNADGYADWTARKIVVQYPMTGDLGDLNAYRKKVVRHEIVHAYLFECGLAESSNETDAWAKNEEMIDWFAFMGPRIAKTWEEAGAI